MRLPPNQDWWKTGGILKAAGFGDGCTYSHDMPLAFGRYFSIFSLIRPAERVCLAAEPSFMPAAICMNLGTV